MQDRANRIGPDGPSHRIEPIRSQSSPWTASARVSTPSPRFASSLASLLRRRLVGALSFSLLGLRRAWHEEAFRVETALALVLIPLALWLGESGVQRALLIGSVLLVLIVELLNTAIEVIVNRISPELHLLSGQAKDLGSAAVLLSIVAAALTWLLVLGA